MALEKRVRSRQSEEGKMKQMRMLLLAVLALLAPARLYAGHALFVCNKTQFEVRYATAEQNTGLLSLGSWVVSGWYPLPPGKCPNVSDSGGGGPVHYAFAFTDSTGTWGTPVFDITSDSDGVYRSDEHLCVTKDPFKYTLAARDLSSY